MHLLYHSQRLCFVNRHASRLQQGFFLCMSQRAKMRQPEDKADEQQKDQHEIDITQVAKPRVGVKASDE